MAGYFDASYFDPNYFDTGNRDWAQRYTPTAPWAAQGEGDNAWSSVNQRTVLWVQRPPLTDEF